MQPDPASQLPPYRQIANAIRASILAGEFAPGERLPSEAEMIVLYGVSRMTARNAKKILEREGLIVSRHGAGVYVRSEGTKTCPACKGKGWIPA